MGFWILIGSFSAVWLVAIVIEQWLMVRKSRVAADSKSAEDQRLP
jgi:hypothetical protein